MYLIFFRSGVFFGKESACNEEDTEARFWSRGQEDPLEQEMETHSSILAWKKIPWTEKPGILQSKSLQRVKPNWATKHCPALLQLRQIVRGKTAYAQHFIPVSWNSSTLATWCGELTHWKRPWCWERLRAGGEGDDRGWDGWTASPTRWIWVWVDCGSWWWAGRPGVLWFMGSQRVGHDWATELNWTEFLMVWKHWSRLWGCCYAVSVTVLSEDYNLFLILTMDS